MANSQIDIFVVITLGSFFDRMVYVHYSTADVNTTITCVLTPQFIEVFVRSLPYSLTVILCVLNGILAIISTLLNLLIMVAIITTPKLRKPSFVLLCNLALTDFTVGITFGPIEVAYLITRAVGWYSWFCTIWKILTATGYFLCSASMYTVTAISFDRYLSVSMSVKYRTVVTKKKAWYTIIIIWLLSAVGASTIGILGNEALLVLVSCVAMLNLIVIVDCYLLSFSIMKQQNLESRPASLAIKCKSESNLCDQRISNALSTIEKRLSDYQERSSKVTFEDKVRELEELGINQQQKPSWIRNNHLAVLEVGENENQNEESKLKKSERTEVSKREENHPRKLHLESKMNEFEDLIHETKANQDKSGYKITRVPSTRSPYKPTLYSPKTDVQSFKKSQHTILIIVVGLFVCYLPYLFVSMLISSHVINSGASKNLAAIMVYVNSTMNAVIMCTRIRSIRRSCWKVIRRLFDRNEQRVDGGMKQGRKEGRQEARKEGRMISIGVVT